MHGPPSSSQSPPVTQVKPASTWQLCEQPSPSRMLPSSQASSNTKPSPHSELQVPLLQSSSVWQVAEQPSRDFSLPSSQLSPGSRVPLPQLVSEPSACRRCQPHPHHPLHRPCLRFRRRVGSAHRSSRTPARTPNTLRAASLEPPASCGFSGDCHGSGSPAEKVNAHVTRFLAVPTDNSMRSVLPGLQAFARPDRSTLHAQATDAPSGSTT